jgi:manganese-dependent inorganic pyrophosphatase
MIYLVSHKNPDTDSIVSSLVMKDFLKRSGQKVMACRIGEVNKETAYILDYLKEKAPSLIKNVSGKKIFLIDHNEIEHGGKGMQKAEIVGILDHHRLGGIETMMPIFCRTEPIGSTSTLVFKMFKEKGFAIDKKQAALLLSGIISDTLKFISPTTTAEDKKIAKELEKISGQDIDNLSREMFKARFKVSKINLKDLLTKDYKEFKLGEKKVGIAVWETPSTQGIFEKKGKIINDLKKIKKRRKVDLIYFGTLDILKRECKLVLIGEEEKRIAEKAFSKKEKENIIYMPGVISRKKQIVPKFAKVLGK